MTDSTPKSPATPEILLEEVSKRFAVESPTRILLEGLGLTSEGERFQALDTLNLTVEPGKLLGLLGHNGAGKSTLLRVAAKVYGPSSGAVTLGGDMTAIFELGLGGSSALTGREFCDWHFRLVEVPDGERKALVTDVEDFAELGDFFDQPIRTYSSGMRARLFFGAATAVPAPIVFMDEVMCVGDEHFRGKSFRRLHRLVSSGAAGILASHDWQTSLRLCDEIAILDKGVVTFRGTPREAVRRYVQDSLQFSGKACFPDRERILAEKLVFRTGEPFRYTVPVTIVEPGPVDFAYAVEAPELGVTLLLGIEERVGEEPGEYQVEVAFDAFPVALERCVLSLYLSAPLESSSMGEREIHDAIAWTSGRSLEMVREGPGPLAGAPLVAPILTWSRIDEEAP